MDLKDQLENLKDDLVNKNEEILHLNWKLGLQDNSTAASIKELQEENARLKVSEEDPLPLSVGRGISVVPEGLSVVGSQAPGPPPDTWHLLTEARGTSCWQGSARRVAPAALMCVLRWEKLLGHLSGNRSHLDQ